MLAKNDLWFLGLFGALFCAYGASDQGPSKLPELVGKEVWQYALTSANDFPQRDPKDWRLLGSNDGTNWTTLDVRKNEVFPERHQRRLFTLGRRGKFNLYRLEIEAVANPASANCLQLAEIEPLGATEDDSDPVPNFEDRVTAQGENGPVESRLQAFDGDAKTKWLDFSKQRPGTRASWIQWQYAQLPGTVVTNVAQLVGLRGRAKVGYPVSISGVLFNQVSGAKVLSFLDGTGALELPIEKPLPFPPGQKLLLAGVSAWRNKRVEIDQCALTPQGPRPPPTPRAIRLEEPLAPEQELQWVEAEGIVQFCTGEEGRVSFELKDGQHVLPVSVAHPGNGVSPPKSGSKVKVRGICAGSLNTEGTLVAGKLWVAGLEAIFSIETTVPEIPETAEQPRVSPKVAASGFTSLGTIRQMGREELARGVPVKVHGVTTELFGAYIQDETGGIELWLGDSPPHHLQIPGLGTYVEVTGQAGWVEAHGPVVRVETLVSLGTGKLPKPQRPSWAALTSGRMMNQWVEVAGVVRSTDGSHLLLVGEGGPLMATIRSASAPLVHQLVDANVRLRGLAIMATDDRGQLQGIQVVVPSLEHVEVERPAAEPFSLPLRTIASLFQVTVPRESAHRVKVEGVVTYCEERRLFLQDQSGAALAIGREEILLDSPPGAFHWAFYQSPNSDRRAVEPWKFKPGDRVEVVGFPESRAGNSPVLTEVVARKVGVAPLISPKPATVADIRLGKLDATLVSLDALLLGREELGGHEILQMRAGPVIFQAMLGSSPDGPLNVPPGSKLRLTGVCQIEPSPFPELGKRIHSFEVLVPSRANLQILEHASWWTLKHALAIAGALVVGLLAAVAWIALLRRQVELRTAQLTKEIEERKRIEEEVELGHRKLLRASRMAGMAEVATNVLHNIGNVLNSTNMLATLIADHVRKSKVPSLVRAVGLIREHREDLGDFLSKDERGRHLPVLLEQLASHLADEQQRIEDKVNALNESVQHIKGVVTMQQKYARVSTLTETVSLAEVVEDAVRLSGPVLAHNGIEVVTRFEASPTLTVDRNKLLQILFNLLENAKRACIEAGGEGKQVRIEVRGELPDRVQVQVHDNGNGISQENLSRIFAQGFSTRKDGHGLGLHSSMLAAQEMGGSLTARSEGPGRGAVFTLELCQVTN